jgi:drug/metabolite transporter (DMT)-like permease
LTYILVILAITLTGAFGSFCLKKAIDQSASRKAVFNNVLLTCLISPWFYCGASLYASSALGNIWLLSKLDYSIVLPLTSLTYIWTMCIAMFFLKEKITIQKALSVTLIIVGSLLISLHQ